MQETKQCPFCAETIQAAAVVCRFCNRDLPVVQPPGIATKVMKASGTTCSACGGFVRGDASTCKHCQARFQPPTAPAPKKKSTLGWVLLAVIVLLGWCAWSQVIAPAMRMATNYAVVYRVTGGARSVDLTYTNEGGDSEQVNDHSVPWYRTFRAHPGQFLYVSAQNQGEDGEVKCEIELNGTVVKSAQSSGAYAIASCSGQI